MNKHLKDKIKSHLDGLKKKKPLEDYCTNCGVCCRPQVTIMSDGEKKARITVNELSCTFMEWDDKSCKSSCPVYGKRHKEAPWCVDIETVILDGIAPNDCPYVETLDGYRGAIVLDGEDYKSVLPLLRETLAKGDFKPIGKERVKEFVSGK